MAESGQDQPIPPYRPKELTLTPDVQANTLGRLVRIANPELGETVLVDITSVGDPTTIDRMDGPLIPSPVNELMQRELNNPDLQNQFALNNGAVVIVTDRFGHPGTPRVYLGTTFTDPDDQTYKEVTTHLLDKAGFTNGSDKGIANPMSDKTVADPHTLFYTELEKAIGEVEKLPGANEDTHRFTSSVGRFIDDMLGEDVPF